VIGSAILVGMKRLIIDLDETITLSAHDGYEHAVPNLPLIARLRDYRDSGFEIVISTSRNMQTWAGNIGKINVHTLPLILAWLERHAVPYDEVYVGKPWCGKEGFYVDDKAIRPAEFTHCSLAQIHALLAAGKAGG
jgi:capsule biosynthesis phosphatase